MRQNHQRGIERRQADIVRAVQEWATANGWTPALRGRALHKLVDGVRWRLDLGVRFLREQQWENRGYQNASGVTGAWRNMHSCPWSLVRVEAGKLIREQNACRPMGSALGGRKRE